MRLGQTARERIDDEAIVKAAGSRGARENWRHARKRALLMNQSHCGFVSMDRAEQLFLDYDFNNSGTIDVVELSKCLRRLLPKDMPYSVRVSISVYTKKRKMTCGRFSILISPNFWT
jgi:hypothetical protein